ncbi:hypothetical protein ACFPZI_03820 [Streptomyces chlorus]|uniref:Uncharacterized protein n=1 Tax=Streptomyces chlorus TaxID=887452 RepID=A0ABW1DTR9_9ACTN
MSIIPDGQAEPGKTVICEAGGRIERLLQRALLIPRTSETRKVQSWEESVLSVARMDADRALSVAEDRAVTKDELARALFFLAQSARAAVRVAEHRTSECEAVPAVPEGAWQLGQCNLPAGHRGTHVNDACHSWGDV